MATSRVLTKNAGKIIEEALRDSRIIPAEQPVQGVDYERGLDSLNNIAKFWQTQDINLWLKEEALLPLVTGQQKYLLGPNGAECADANLSFNTTLTAALVATDTVVTVASSADMVAAPNILTSDPTDSVQDWSAINSATLSVSSGLVITNVAATAGGADYSLATTAGETYRVRFNFTLGTSTSVKFSVLNVATEADSVTLTASGTDNELTITASTTEIIFRIENVTTTTGHTSTTYDLTYVLEGSGSRVGILQTDGTRHWDYVLNVDSATSIDLENGMTSAAADGASVFFYTTKLSRPMRILSMRYASSITGSEIPTNQWSREQYFNQPDKDSTGTVNQWYYSPQITDGELYIWQVANSDDNILRFTYVKAALVYTENTDELEFPSEFYQPLKWAIAADLAPSYGVKPERRMELKQEAYESLEAALAHDNEMASMQIAPDFN
jgi:hypothetical protein